jgi:hypothetical protein
VLVRVKPTEPPSFKRDLDPARCRLRFKRDLDPARCRLRFKLAMPIPA